MYSLAIRCLRSERRSHGSDVGQEIRNRHTFYSCYLLMQLNFLTNFFSTNFIELHKLHQYPIYSTVAVWRRWGSCQRQSSAGEHTLHNRRSPILCDAIVLAHSKRQTFHQIYSSRPSSDGETTSSSCTSPSSSVVCSSQASTLSGQSQFKSPRETRPLFWPTALPLSLMRLTGRYLTDVWIARSEFGGRSIELMGC